MDRYKRYLELGDEALARSTRFRSRKRESDGNQQLENPENEAESVRNMNFEQELFGRHAIAVGNVNDEYGLFDTQEIHQNAPCSSEYLKHVFAEDNILNTMEWKSNPKSLLDFIESEDFLNNINIPVNKSKGEIFLMILKYSVLNNLSMTAITNLFNLINCMFAQPILPNSKYIIENLLNPKDEAEFHAVCHNCSAYIGKFENVKLVKICNTCNNDLDLLNPSNTSYFVLLNPSVAIANKLQTHENYYDDVMNRGNDNGSVIQDIYDGQEYKKFVNSLPDVDKYRYVTAIFNTDGAPKFKCSQFSVWPLYLMLNEIPKQERLDGIITCGLWFHRKKPNMSVFLNPLVDIINKLSENGLICNIKNEDRLVKLYVLLCCVDSVARAPIQGIKQFNGYYSCSWCLHPGVYAEGCIRLPIQLDIPLLRSHASTVEHMYEAASENPIFGVQYPSPLINLQGFNIITGFVPDYMHCMLEGVAKQMTDYYLSNANETEIARMDTIILNFALPNQTGRLTRKLSERNDWKAREWENFVLLLSIPLFKLILNNKLLNHWILFVESFYILLKTSITIEELDRADEMLHEYVVKAEELFGIKAMTSNMHQLLHISKSVLNWGPLSLHSTFAFESKNRELLIAIKCSRGVTQQIVRFVHMNDNMLTLEQKVYPEACSAVKIFYDDILLGKVQNSYKPYEITYFGRGSNTNDAVINLLSNEISDSVKTFKKIVKDRCLYTSCISRSIRSNNSFAQLKNKSFIRIEVFVVDEETQIEVTLCNIVHTTFCFANKYKQFQKIQSISDEVISLPTNEISTICVFLSESDNDYICPVPNMLHY